MFKDKGYYEKALENITKSLTIRKLLLGDTHKDVSKSYNTIGLIMKDKAEYD
jgi:hypothetical protein